MYSEDLGVALGKNRLLLLSWCELGAGGNDQTALNSARLQQCLSFPLALNRSGYNSFEVFRWF